MKKKVIYFDFDRTLIDTDALKVEQAKRIAKITNLSDEQLSESMKEYIESINDHLVFNPQDYALFLEEKYGVMQSDIMKIYVTDSNYIADFLFPETLEVLKMLKNRGHSLGIFSAAMPGPQRLKIERTRVLEYIDEALVIIDPQKLGIDALEQLPDEVIVIDDDIQVIKKLARHSPRFIPIWCNRKTDEKLLKIITITHLSELLTLNLL